VSLAIDANAVTAVLLADGWHVTDTNSFDLDSFEFIDGNDQDTLHAGGDSGVCATGFAFSEDGQRVAGPLTSVIAVRYDR